MCYRKQLLSTISDYFVNSHCLWLLSDYLEKGDNILICLDHDRKTFLKMQNRIHVAQITFICFIIEEPWHFLSAPPILYSYALLPASAVHYNFFHMWAICELVKHELKKKGVELFE